MWAMSVQLPCSFSMWSFAILRTAYVVEIFMILWDSCDFLCFCQVDGEWKLLYSTISILGSKRTKLGLRDFISLGDFVQAIDVDQVRYVPGSPAFTCPMGFPNENHLYGMMTGEGSEQSDLQRVRSWDVVRLLHHRSFIHHCLSHGEPIKPHELCFLLHVSVFYNEISDNKSRAKFGDRETLHQTYTCNFVSTSLDLHIALATLRPWLYLVLRRIP